jgi:hypothetical protein
MDRAGHHNCRPSPVVVGVAQSTYYQEL